MDLTAFRAYLRARLNEPQPHGTHAERARALGVEPAMLYQWRAGLREIPEGRIEALAQLVGLTVTVQKRVLDANGDLLVITPPAPD